jgi:hypothetical protein
MRSCLLGVGIRGPGPWAVVPQWVRVWE